MLRSFALPVIQLWGLKRGPKSLDEKERWAFFKNPNLNWAMLYNAEMNDIFNLMLHSEVHFLVFSINAIWWFLFVRGYHSKLYNVVQLTSEWAKIERFQWTTHDWFRLNFSLSYDIARKDGRNFSINVRIKFDSSRASQSRKKWSI